MATELSERFGNYEILAKLGQGGMAEVFRARVLEGPRAGWIVALKRMLPELAQDPEYVDRFTSEADLSKALHHPNIVQVLDVGVSQDVYYMAMEYVDGRDLGQILKKCKARGIQLPVDFGVYLVRVLLAALAYAHTAKSPSGRALGLVHCDVSPSNLFISRVGEVKLGDFGIARGRTMSGAAEGSVEGKPYYLSPEAFAGEVSPQVDLWAAAVVLYEAITLERPFSGANPDEVLRHIQAREYVPLSKRRPDAPKALEAVLTKAWAPDEAKRFPSAVEFFKTLGPLYDSRIGTALAIAGVVRGLFGAEDAA